jgi:DNA topoisomerase-1
VVLSGGERPLFEDGILERFAATMKGYRSQSKREQLLAQVVATAAAA